MTNAFIGALVAGLMVLLVGYLLYVIFPYSKVSEHFTKVTQLQYHLVMLFVLGFLAFLLMQFVGINKWYCKNEYFGYELI